MLVCSVKAWKWLLGAGTSLTLADRVILRLGVDHGPLASSFIISYLDLWSICLSIAAWFVVGDLQTPSVSTPMSSASKARRHQLLVRQALTTLSSYRSRAFYPWVLSPDIPRLCADSRCAGSFRTSPAQTTTSITLTNIRNRYYKSYTHSSGQNTTTESFSWNDAEYALVLRCLTVQMDRRSVRTSTCYQRRDTYPQSKKSGRLTAWTAISRGGTPIIILLWKYRYSVWLTASQSITSLPSICTHRLVYCPHQSLWNFTDCLEFPS